MAHSRRSGPALPGVPRLRALEAICRKAMAPRPEDRYASARALADDLEHWLADEPVAADREGWHQRLARWARRHQSWMVAGTTTLLLVTVVSVVATVFLDWPGIGVPGPQPGESPIRRRPISNATASEKSDHRVQMQSALYAFDRALDLIDKDKVDEGMLWLGHALSDAPEDAEDLRRAIRANLGSGQARLHAVKERFDHPGRVWAATFSPDGKTIVTGSADNTARLWNAATGQPIGEPLGHQTVVKAVAFSPDGKTIADGQLRHGTVRLWDAATGQPIGPPLRTQAGVDAVAFSPDGKTILTGSYDKTARLWDAATGQPIGPPLRHQGAVYAVAFSPDGKTILTGSADRTARLWDADTGRPIGEPMTHRTHGLCRGLQPRRQDRRDRELGQDGAVLGRRHRPADRPAADASRPGACRGLQPRRQDRRDRGRRRDGAALGRRHRPAHRAAAPASGRGLCRGLQPRRQGHS